MSDLGNRLYRKTDRAIPLGIIDNSNMQKLLDAMDNSNDVKVIAKKAQVDPPVFKKTFIELVKLGLIEKIDSEEAYVDSAIIQKMRDMLNEYNGLIGDLSLDDAAKVIDMDLNRIPLHDLAFFIEVLAEEIPSDKNRYTFKKQMVEELKAMGY